MELAFETKPLRKLCEEEKYARKVLGPRVADKLKHRLADLRAASSADELVAGNPKVIESDSLSLMKVSLCEGYCLLFCANHVKNPMTEKRIVDWRRVSRIMILSVEDENDGN